MRRCSVLIGMLALVALLAGCAIDRRPIGGERFIGDRGMTAPLPHSDLPPEDQRYLMYLP